MESVFSRFSINPFKIEDSNINENWPRFSIISKVNFSVDPRLSCVSYLMYT